MIQVLIDGVDKSTLVDFGTLKTSDQINAAADTCSFSIKEYGSQTFRPDVNAEIIVNVDSTRRFGGVIVDVEQALEGHSVISHRINCKDWTQHLDRENVTERYEGNTVQEIILDLIDRYADHYGFTGNGVQGSTLDVASIAFGEITLSECFNKLARLTGYSWYVDNFKDVHFFAKNDEDAPFDLATNSDNFIFDSLVIKSDLAQIRNRVKIRGGDARGSVRTKKWAGDAESDIFSTDHKFAELPTVKVDGVSKTVGVDFLNEDTDYECMWNFQQKYIRFTAGNVPPAPTAPDITNIDITGIPLRPIIVQKQDNDSIIKYGLYEFVKYNDSLKTNDEALQFAQTELDIYAGKIKGGHFQTYTGGLKSGQTMNINIPERGVNEDFLIQGVTFHQISKDTFVWDVKIATLKTIGMIDILQKLLLRENINEGEDETLLNFFALSDGWQIGDALGNITKTTHKDYVWEQGNPANDTYTNPIIWNKFSWL